MPSPQADPGLLRGLVKDGRPLLLFTALCLVLSGLFALFLAATGHFLPHDVQFLGMTPQELCQVHECRIVHFMIHDRVSFGGALIAVGILYLWLAEFPLGRRQPWAWAVFLLSGLFGFGSFLAYLGYGYLDTWHGAATLALLPCFVLGLIINGWAMSWPGAWRDLVHPAEAVAWRSPYGCGKACLLAATMGMITGGAVIMTVGMTCVFVPQDLRFMGVTVEELHALNPRLVPLIAHDRAGFGGGVCCCGLVMFCCVWRGAPSRSLWQALTLAGTIGFATAIFVHPAVGYNDLIHLLPALLGALLFSLGMILTRPTHYARTPSAAVSLP